MSHARVAIATATDLPHADPNQDLLFDALGAVGIDPIARDWRDRSVDWSAYDLVVIRSTWNYMHHFEEFASWATSVPNLANPGSIVEWNMDKRYLDDLARAGVPTVETEWIEAGDPVALPMSDVVVKPNISGGAMDSGRFGPDDHDGARMLIDRIHQSGKVAMLQPYLDHVDVVGESALIFFADTYSHSVGKGAKLTTPGCVGEDVITQRSATDAELEMAAAVLEAVPFADSLLYARVDLLTEPDATVVLLELEVVEPFLFLEYEPSSPARFARAIAQSLERA